MSKRKREAPPAPPEKNLEAVGLFDMDGTLVDYDAALLAAMPRKRLRKRDNPSINDRELVAHLLAEHPAVYPDWFEERRTKVTKRKRFWRRAPPIATGLRVFAAAQRAGFENHILSKGPSSKPNAWSGKVLWAMEHVPGTPVEIVTTKGLVYGRFLVDDWPPYILAWLKWRPRSYVLCPAYGYNESLSTNPQVLRYQEGLPDAFFDEVFTAIMERNNDAFRACRNDSGLWVA